MVSSGTSEDVGAQSELIPELITFHSNTTVATKSKEKGAHNSVQKKGFTVLPVFMWTVTIFNCIVGVGNPNRVGFPVNNPES